MDVSIKRIVYDKNRMVETRRVVEVVVVVRQTMTSKVVVIENKQQFFGVKTWVYRKRMDDVSDKKKFPHVRIQSGH